MNFVDKANVTVQAGGGGSGLVSFRHEKYIDRGGPDGGDGGKGGNVVLVASRNQNTLVDFRYQKELKAEDGTSGGKRNRHGKNGADLLVPVPVGTQLLSEAGQLLADLTADGQRAIVAAGGRGGFGNAHFTSSRRQAPRIAEKGEPGEAFAGQLELKMIADVGLVGLPNAGKSTLLSVISNARPDIADYPFTTLKPNLGMVDVDKHTSLLFADIPGLIEGAAAGKGLGDEFLRHVERTAVLLHLVDAYNDDVAAAYKAVQGELKAYKIDLSGRPQIAALTKIEGMPAGKIAAKLAALKKTVPKGTQVLTFSAHTREGLAGMLRAVQQMVADARAKQAVAAEETRQELPVLRLASNDLAWHVEKRDGGFVVTGSKIERFALRTDFGADEGIRRLRDIIKKMGIMHELIRQGVKPGDRIAIAGKGSFLY